MADYRDLCVKFFSSEPAQSAAKPLSPAAVVAIRSEDTPRALILYFSRDDQGNQIHDSTITPPDMTWSVPEAEWEALLKLPESSPGGYATIGHYGAYLVKAVASGRIKLQIDASFFTLMRKGYLSVLLTGGKEVASVLAEYGFNFTNIKNALSKLRG